MLGAGRLLCNRSCLPLHMTHSNHSHKHICKSAHAVALRPVSGHFMQAKQSFKHAFCLQVRAETLKFKEEGVFSVVKDVFLPWYNAYR